MKRPLMCFCILLTVISILRFYMSDYGSPPGELPKEAVTLQGRLDSWENESGYTILYLSDVFFYDNSVKEISDNNSIGLRCYTKDVCNFKLGQNVAVRGFLTLPQKAGNRGEFDAVAYYSRIGYEYILYEGEILAQGEEYDVLLQLLYEFKCYAQVQLNTYLEKENAGIMAAMLLGDKTNINKDIKLLYRSMGIYHILAISGVNTLNLVSLSKSQMPNLRASPQVLLRKFTLFYQQILSGFYPLVVLPLFRGCFSKLTKWQKEYLFAKV